VNPLRCRLGLLAPTTTPLWTGTANGAQSTTFTLAVTTVSGALPTDSSGLLLVRAGVDLVRIKTHSGSTLYLAENPATFTAGDALAVYDLRLPWPRYQRLVSTTVYKDYDIPFPATWQHSLPPTALVTPEAAWLEVGDTQVFSALNSQIMAPDPTGGLTATWDCTGWGTGTAYGSAGGVTNCYFPLTPTATGLHYLKCSLTDEWGGAFSRYIPVWVGTTPTAVLGASLDWSLERGWRGSVTLDGTLTWFDYSPVALVDLDTAEIIFYGFYSPQRVSGDLGLATTEGELLSPLGAASALYGYPFIVTDLADPGSAPPDNWAEVGKLTCARALWYLLVWHSVLPQLVNLALGDIDARRIAGQTFSAGNLLNLIDQITQAAFYVLRAAATGALTLEVQPLYADAATWAGLPAYTLTAANRSAAYTYTPPQARCSEVRCSGVYLAVGGSYAPAIARCPAHPAAWGAGTNEVTKLAPLSAAELLQWSARHFAVENQTAVVDVDVWTEIDPAYARVATDIPGASALALDSLRLTYDPGALSWQTQLSGRTYSAAPGADYVPIPPAVVIPAPTPPPVLPPLDPLPPSVLWPLTVYVATVARGVFMTNNFSADPLTPPVWTAIRAKATTGELLVADVLRVSPVTGTQLCIENRATLNTCCLYRRTNDTWAPILTGAQAVQLLNEYYWTYGAHLMWVDCAADGTWYLWIRSHGSNRNIAWIARSTDDGLTWTALSQSQYCAYSISQSNMGNGIYAEDGYWFTAGNSVTGGYGRAWCLTTAMNYSQSNSLGFAMAYFNHFNPVSKVLYGMQTDATLVVVNYPGTGGVIGYTPVGAGETMAVSRNSFPAITHHLTNGLVMWGVGLRSNASFARRLLKTTDGWDSVTLSADMGIACDIVFSNPLAAGYLLLARQHITGDTPGPTDAHHLWIATDDGATVLARSGADPQNTDTTTSIPYDCGGVAHGGVQWGLE